MNQLSSDSLRIHSLIFPAFEKKEEHASYPTRRTTVYEEISLKIFKGLEFQDLCQAKLICREWKQLIESSPLAEDIYRIGLKLAIQKNNPMCEKVCAKKLFQEAYCIEKLGDIYQEKGTSETLLQAAGLYNYALQIVSDDKKKFFEERLLKAQHLLINLCQGKVLDNNRIRNEFEGNRQALKSLRRRINKNILRLPESPSPQQVRELYGRIADRMKFFFSSLVNQAIDVLGPAPCKYSMIGFGSLAREEMTPYSDLEFGILIKEDNDANKKYFRNLTNLIHLKVINLGETILPALNIPCLQTIGFFDGITPRGFAFDGAGVEGKGCKTPFGNDGKTFELIQTPGKMAQYIAKDEKGQWWHNKEPHLPMELLTFTHLLGNFELTREYGEKLQEKLNVTNQEEFNLRQYLAKQHLVLADMEAFDPRMGDLSRQGMLFKVKNDLYRFPHLALDRLALFKKIGASSSFARIDELNKLGVIKNSAAVRLNEWMSIALFMRLKTYSHYQAQQEMMNPLIKPFRFEEPELIKQQFALDHESLEKLKKIYRIFIPFYQAMQDFLAGREETLKLSDLEDNSPQTHGDIALRLFQQEEAMRCYILAKQKNPQNSQILSALGIIYLAQGNIEKAAKYGKKALAISLELFSENHPTLAGVYINLAKIYHDKSKLGKAVKYGEKALAIAQKLLGDTHSSIPIIYNNLAQIYQKQGNFKLAADYTRKAHNITFKLFEEYYPTMETYHFHLGHMYKDQGNLDKATEHANKAVAIALRIYGENHPTAALAYNNLGQIYNDQGNLVQAAEHIDKALTVGLKVLGKNHPTVGAFYSSRGKIYYEQGNLKEAIEHNEKGLSIYLKLFGEDHLEVAKAYNSLGLIYKDQGNLEKAAEYSNKALTIGSGLFGKDHPTVAIAYNTLGQICQKQRKLPEAALHTKQALDIFHRLFGENSPSVAKIYNNLGTIYQDQNNLDEAAEYSNKALAISLKLFGENHSDIASIYGNLGLIYKEQGSLEKAAEYAQKALALDIKLFGENHPNVAIDYHNLGLIYKEQGSLEKAAEYINKALRISIRAYGIYHPTVTAINAALKSLNASLSRKL
ncbi:tetratricopeptide repeat protein [Neochlamydia sp. AcF65]|uniref:tetratricopeptide repeat protein n=1 Tax=Neochlamydia sp. AcF65 TaxID=2795735 RepID=UPI001BC95FA7|nr:tetratricopeptide repeat protein [Neochlamydia sp. AcF65]